ncbi:CD209 antigen-like protein C isoform 2-T2 [Symphorus nematophorus]
MEDIDFNTAGVSDEVEVREVDIYESSDMYGGLRAETQSPVHQQPGTTSVRTSVRAMIVCLVLSCVLLLAAAIGIGLHCKIKPQTHNKSCTEERKQTWTELSEFCTDGCSYFNNSFYYISRDVKKSWSESRQDCKGKGADLVIVNNKEEQEFIRSLSNKFWIGLTDTEKNETWRWVDGSVLNEPKFWGDRQPSWKFETQEEDCVEIVGGIWNDAVCTTENVWICEKVTDL